MANASYSDSASYPAILGIINALRLLLSLAYSGLLWASFGLGIAAINYYKNDARYDQRISILLILSVAIAGPLLTLAAGIWDLTLLKRFKPEAEPMPPLQENLQLVPSYLHKQYAAVSGALLVNGIGMVLVSGLIITLAHSHSEFMAFALGFIIVRFSQFTFNSGLFLTGFFAYQTWLRKKDKRLSKPTWILTMIAMIISLIFNVGGLLLIVSGPFLMNFFGALSLYVSVSLMGIPGFLLVIAASLGFKQPKLQDPMSQD